MAEPYKKGPRKLNIVSILFIGGLAFGIYAAARFVPPYWTQWQAKEKLRDACAAMYPMQRYEPAIRAAEMQKLQTRVQNELVNDVGIDDPDLIVELDDTEPGWVIARADYRIVVKHPIGKPTVMHFTPEVRMDTSPTPEAKK